MKWLIRHGEPYLSLITKLPTGSASDPTTKRPSSSSPTEHRPISLLYFVSKCLEHHIFNWYAIYIWFFLTATMDLDQVSLQKEFWHPQPNYGSLLSILETPSAVFSLISTKVFDSIIYQPLLNILSSYKFHILIIDWLNIHLHFKWQQVVVKGSASSKTPATSGVPQDSILCPLFLYYMLMTLSPYMQHSIQTLHWLFTLIIFSFHLFQNPIWFSSIAKWH